MNRPARDSGVTWIGDIPEGWAVEPFRRLFRESKEINGPTPVGPMLSISGYRGVEEKVYESESLIRDNDQLENYRVVRPGQLAVNTMWLNYAGLGVSLLLGHVSPAYRAYWISKRLDGRYAHHLLRSSIYVQGYTALLTGIRPNSLQMSRADLMAFPVLVPPLGEQRAIADYLDRETAQIDAFIAKNEELVTLLTERRAASITSVLTSGLGDGPRSSDDRWFGAIPVHWESMPLRYLLRRIEQGVSPQAEGGLAEGAGQVGVLKSGCVNGGVYRPTEHKLLPDGFDFDRSLLVRPGDLLVNRASGSIPLLGSAALVKKSPYQLILSDKTFRLIPGVRTTRNYLYWLLNSRIYREQVESSVSGAEGLANNLPQSSLRRFVLPVPPREEQDQIDSYLTERCAQIDKSIDAARRGIELARERRAALISAAVTGKIDVGVAA